MMSFPIPIGNPEVPTVKGPEGPVPGFRGVKKRATGRAPSLNIATSPVSHSTIRLLRRNSPAVGSADRRLAQPRGARGFAP